MTLQRSDPRAARRLSLTGARTGFHTGVLIGALVGVAWLLPTWAPARAAATTTTTALPSAGAGPGLLLMDFEGQTEVADEPARQGASFRIAGRPWPRAARATARRGTVAAEGAGPSWGAPTLLYEGGDDSQRQARVIDDPTAPGNRVLELVVREPHVRVAGPDGSKARVQINVYDNDGAAEVYQSVRLRLGADLKFLDTFPRALTWFTIAEWWNNAGWTGEPDAFRISLDLARSGPSDAPGLNLVAKATVRPPGSPQWRTVVWSRSLPGHRLPLDTWLKVETWFRDGGAADGRFVLAVTPEGGSRTVLVDLTGPTRHPDAVDSDGVRHLNPVKLYTSAEVVRHVRDRGGVLRLLWDDLRLQACPRPAASTSTTATPAATGLPGGVSASTCEQAMALR